MKRYAAMAALVMLATLSMPPATAGDESAQYVAGHGVTARVRNGIGVGGYQFAATGVAPTRIRVLDTAGPGVGVLVCQDTNGNGSCGDGDARRSFCSTTGFVALSGFNGTLPVSVFVRAVPGVNTPTNCETPGTTGTVTLTH